MSCEKWMIVLCSVIYFITTPAASAYQSNATATRLSLDVLLSIAESDGVGQIISKKMLEYWPGFYPDRGVSEACWNDSVRFLMDLKTIRLHALKIWDASAKISSGILNGNINQYGDYDLCMEGGGRYCLAYLQLDLTRSDIPELHTINSMIHSYNAFRSSLDDPGHRVPRYSTIHWGICVPSSCTPRDVEKTLGSTLSSSLANTGLSLKARIFPEMCPEVPRPSFPPEAIIMGSLFGLLLFVIAVATLYDFSFVDDNKTIKNNWLKVSHGFSLKRNIGKLLDPNGSNDDITSVHAIRFLNAVLLYFSHKSLSVFYNPFVNRTHMSMMLGAGWTTVTRAASLYTDPFIMLSGLLTSYSLLKSNAPIRFQKEIIFRLFRLLPSLAALIAFCTFILPYLGSGPQWPLVIESHAQLCKKYWWRNFLLIHNYFGFKNMCLTHTHHVGIDSQLFLTSLIVIPFLKKWPKRCLQILMSVALASTALRFYATYDKDLNLYVHYGNPVKRMFNTADFSYILPTHRATVYIMGIVLGYILRLTGRNYFLKKSQIGVGWMIALGCLYLSFVPWSKMGDMNYTYDRMDAANYSAFAPITWCLLFSWIIFLSHTGNLFDSLNRLTECRLFLIFSRVSYSFYLTQFPVFFYNVGRVRNNSYFSVFVMFDILEIVAVICVSILLTILVEMPFQNIRTVLFNNQNNKKLILKNIKNTETNGNVYDKQCLNGSSKKIISNGVNHSEIHHVNGTNGFYKSDDSLKSKIIADNDQDYWYDKTKKSN